MSIVMDARCTIAKILALQPNLRTARPKPNPVFQDRGLGEPRFKRHTAPQDTRRDIRVRLGVPFSLFGCAAKDTVFRAALCR